MSSRIPGAVALSLLLAGTLMSCDDDTSVHLGSSSQSTVTTSKPFVNAGGGALYATVTVALKDDGGNAVFGKAITLISSRGYKDTIGVNAGATDKNGVASFIVQSSTVGKATLTAVDTTDAVGIDQTVDVTFAGPVDAGVSTVTASPTTVLADGTTASIITVTLKDSAGTPVDGKTISLQQPAGGTADINGNVTSPDQIGVRTFDVTSLNTGSVVFNGIDQTDSIIPTQTVTVTFTPTERHNSTIAASPYAVTADGATTSTITVTLKDPNGAAIPGHGVALHSSRNAADTTAIVSDTTNSSGVATFTIKSANPGQSTLSATDTTNNLDLVPTVVVGFSEYTFVATGAAVNFTVPAGVTTLNVSAAGGAGGIGQFRGPDTRALGAEGASISAVNFTVVAGHVLQVVTGGLGGHGRLVNGAGGGGGGTSLYDSTSSTSFFILGGGGGDSNSTEGCAASTTTTPNNCGGTGGGQNTALNGTGGGGGNAAGGGGGGGGRADPGTDGAVGGQGPGLGGGGGYAATGGLGTQVSSSLSGNGAFGTAAGGGGGTSNGGGGGGYVGGGGGKSSGLGGGAASFCSVATTISADNLGDGFVTISW